MGGLSHRPLPSSVEPNELILFGCWEWSFPMTSVCPPIWTKYCRLVLPLYTPYGSFAATASVLSCCIRWLNQPLLPRQCMHLLLGGASLQLVTVPELSS